MGGSFPFGLFARSPFPFVLRRLLALGLSGLLPLGLRRAFPLDLSHPRGQFGFSSTFALGLLGLFRLRGPLTLSLGGTLRFAARRSRLGAWSRRAGPTA